MNAKDHAALSAAICRACGIEPDTVTAITYQHQVGCRATITVTRVAEQTDIDHLDSVTRKYTIRIEESE